MMKLFFLFLCLFSFSLFAADFKVPDFYCSKNSIVFLTIPENGGHHSCPGNEGKDTIANLTVDAYLPDGSSRNINGAVYGSGTSRRVTFTGYSLLKAYYKCYKCSPSISVSFSYDSCTKYDCPIHGEVCIKHNSHYYVKISHETDDGFPVQHEDCFDTLDGKNIFLDSVKKCSSCGGVDCAVCGHVCRECPDRVDCSPYNCQVCKKIFCSVHQCHYAVVVTCCNGKSHQQCFSNKSLADAWEKQAHLVRTITDTNGETQIVQYCGICGFKDNTHNPECVVSICSRCNAGYVHSLNCVVHICPDVSPDTPSSSGSDDPNIDYSEGGSGTSDENVSGGDSGSSGGDSGSSGGDSGSSGGDSGSSGGDSGSSGGDSGSSGGDSGSSGGNNITNNTTNNTTNNYDQSVNNYDNSTNSYDNSTNTNIEEQNVFNNTGSGNQFNNTGSGNQYFNIGDPEGVVIPDTVYELDLEFPDFSDHTESSDLESSDFGPYDYLRQELNNFNSIGSSWIFTLPLSNVSSRFDDVTFDVGVRLASVCSVLRSAFGIVLFVCFTIWWFQIVKRIFHIV